MDYTLTDRNYSRLKGRLTRAIKRLGLERFRRREALGGKRMTRHLPIYRPDHDNPLYELYDDPSTPHWAQDLIREGLTRDPVDVATILDVIATAFRERADRILRERRA